MAATLCRQDKAMRDILAYANNYRTITPSMRYAAELAKMFTASGSILTWVETK